MPHYLFAAMDQSTLSLFPCESLVADALKDEFIPDPEQQVKLGQYATPFWAAQALVERHYGHLNKSDLVIEPSCHAGSFLMALPIEVPAIGVEIDPRAAAIARAQTKRQIVEGDFLTVPLKHEPTVILGNPPFNLALINGFLRRSHELLPDGGQVGFILPTYIFQTARTVVELNEKWSINQELIPRNLFPGLSLPLMFARFTKDKLRTLVGFALYWETADMHSMKKQYREILSKPNGSVWRNAVKAALTALGGRASLPEIYREIEGKRPTATQNWKEQIRKVIRHYKEDFFPEGGGIYRQA